MHGKPYSYHASVKHMNSAGVLATLRNHEYYLSRVPQTVAQALKSDWGLWIQQIDPTEESVDVTAIKSTILHF